MKRSALKGKARGSTLCLPLGFLLLQSSSSHAGGAPEQAELMAALVPRGEVSVSIMALKAPDPWTALAGRLQAALSADPEWSRDYVQNAPPGPLPYHPKLGLSQDEYEQLQSLSKQMRLVPAAAARLTVREPAEGVFRFEGGPELRDLAGVELDVNSKTLRTPVGTCTAFRTLSVAATAPAGEWEGYSCRVGEDPNDSLASVWMAFDWGLRPDKRTGVLFYRFKILEGTRVKSRADVYITYPLR